MTEEMTLQEAKSKAYDAIASKEYWELELRKINEYIANYKEPEMAESGKISKKKV